LLLIPLLVGCPTAGSPEPSDDDDSAPVLDLQDLLDDAVADSAGFGGGVLRVSRGDELLWEGASGDAVRDPTTPMEVTDTFEIASVSKTFTAALTLLLADEGLFGLDDPLGDHLPSSLLDDLLVVDGLDRSGTITIRQCLNHTSGLPDYWNDPPFEAWGWCNAFCVAYIDDVNRFWEPEEILAFVPGLDPIGQPGHGYHYSDTGYVLLGLLAEEVTGEELHALYRSRILEPLGSTETWLEYREDGLPDSHRWEADWNMTGQVHNSADWAGGGLASSAADLARFIDALDGELLDGERMQQWVSTGTPGVDYGLGLFRVDLPDGLGEVWGHDGYGNSWMYRWPERQITFTGTLNQTDNDWWPMVVEAAQTIKEGSDPYI